MKLTNEQFCARLRKAKKIALRNYPNFWCIADACNSARILLGKVAIFDEDGVWSQWSSGWVYGIANSSDDIAAVFDNSIRDLGEEP